MKRLTPKQVRVLELAMDVCEYLGDDSKDTINSDNARSTFDLLQGLLDSTKTKSVPLAEEPS